MQPPLIRAELRNPTAQGFDIALSVPGARIALSEDEREAFVVTDGDAWLEAMRELARVHRDGVDALDPGSQVERLRRMIHIAMERSVVAGYDRDRVIAVAIAAALHQLAEFVAMERVVCFQFSWSGGQEPPVVMTQFATGPLTPIVLDLGVVERAARLA